MVDAWKTLHRGNTLSLWPPIYSIRQVGVPKWTPRSFPRGHRAGRRKTRDRFKSNSLVGIPMVRFTPRFLLSSIPIITQPPPFTRKLCRQRTRRIYFRESRGECRLRYGSETRIRSFPWTPHQRQSGYLRTTDFTPDSLWSPINDHNYYAMSGEINAQVWDFFTQVGLKSSTVDGRAPTNSALNRQLTTTLGETASYFELPIRKLRGAVSALKGVKYDPSQEQLPSILDHVARSIADLLPRLPDLISSEHVYHFQGPSDRGDMSLFSQSAAGLNSRRGTNLAWASKQMVIRVSMARLDRPGAQVDRDVEDAGQPEDGLVAADVHRAESEFGGQLSDTWQRRQKIGPQGRPLSFPDAGWRLQRGVCVGIPQSARILVRSLAAL